MKALLAIVLSLAVATSFAQNVGIGTTTPDGSAQLDVLSTSRGMLVPRMSSVQRGLIANPATGLLIYQTDPLNNGFYYNSGTPAIPNWISLSTSVNSWSLTGNNNAVPSVNFLGTINNQPLIFRVNNDLAGRLDASLKSYFIGRFSGQNASGALFCTGMGDSALFALTNGSNNVAIGSASLRNNLTGLSNSAVGTQALYSNTSAHFNTAVGYRSQYSVNAPYNTSIGSNSLFYTTGESNTAAGYGSLFENTTGYSNVAIGVSALGRSPDRSNLVAVGDSALLNNGLNAVVASNSIGNTAIGSKAMYTNTTGALNTALGKESLFNNNDGNSNTATGYHALFNNTAGSSNTANGYLALNNNTTGYSNVAVGTRALFSTTIVSNTVAVGDSALFNNGLGTPFNGSSTGNTAIGSKAMYNNNVGFGNTSLGASSLYNSQAGAFNTAIGSSALFSLNNGNSNAGFGDRALNSLTSGQWNIGIGFMSGGFQKGSGNILMGSSNSTASASDSVINNIILGSRAGITLRGSANILMGYDAGGQLINGSGNVGLGDSSLATIVISEAVNTGFSNIAIGTKALAKNFSHSNLVAVGDSALYNNGAGGTSAVQSVNNTAVGSKTLFNNINGSSNTALGYWALKANQAGSHNIAIGANAMINSISNGGNVAVGDSALYSYNDASFSDSLVAIGEGALRNNSNGYYNTALGAGGLRTNTGGNSNTSVGTSADVSLPFLSNATAIGYNAVATASNQVMLGNTTVTSVKAAGSFVIYSDGRFKKNIRENVPGLDFIISLRPVTYHYDITGLNAFLGVNNTPRESRYSQFANEAIRQKEQRLYSGFVAQEVEATAAKLGYEFSGLYKPQNDKDAYGLSYADFVVPLVKAIQEQQVMIKRLQEEVELLKQKK